MILLDTAINGLNDVTFTLKDIIYIAGFIAGGITAWFKLQRDKENLQNQHINFVNMNTLIINSLTNENTKLKTMVQEESLHAKNSRYALRKDLTESMEKKELALHNKIEAVEKEAEQSFEKLEKKIEEVRKENDIHTKTIISEIQKIKGK